MDMFLRSICWHMIRKAFPCSGALDPLGGNHSHVSPSHARDNATTVHLLPPNHPQTIRVRRIAAHLIATACECDDDGRSRFGSLLDRRIRWRSVPVNGRGRDLDWRVHVALDDHGVYANSTYNGILTVSTGFLKHMPTDADIAAVLGHEVAHVMARHGLTTLRNSFWVRFLVNFAADLLNVPRDRFEEDRWEFIFQRPWCFRKEYEADHLGLLLVAAAGYDPRIAPKLYEKIGLLREWMTTEWRRYYSTSDDDDDDLWSTHPAGTERVRRLSQAKVMGEALDLYRQALASGKGKHTQALDSWSSTFTFGLSWALFWAEGWLQGVPNLCNSVRSTFSCRPSRDHVAHQVPPANRWRNKGIAAPGSLSVQKAILFRYGTADYASDWQLQNNHVHHRAHHSVYVQGNTGSPCATLPPEVKLFMWQLRHGRLWPADRSPHQRHRHLLQMR